MSKEGIHDELDELALQLLLLSQNLVHVKLMLEQTMKEGFMGLAQSRKSMSGGPTSVSSLQLPSEDWEPFEAQIKVIKSECVRAEINVKFNYLSMEKKGSNVESLDSGLTNRKASKKGEETDIAKTAKDPLKWFGILVPNSLRQSQKQFAKSTELAVEAANLHNEIRGIVARQKYLTRRLKKADV